MAVAGCTGNNEFPPVEWLATIIRAAAAAPTQAVRNSLSFPSIPAGRTISATPAVFSLRRVPAIRTFWPHPLSGLQADAYLFLGSRDTLNTGGEAFDLEGTPYGAELRRRWKITFPNPPVTLPKSDGSIRPLLQRAFGRVIYSIEGLMTRTSITR